MKRTVGKILLSLLLALALLLSIGALAEDEGEEEPRLYGAPWIDSWVKQGEDVYIYMPYATREMAYEAAFRDVNNRFQKIESTLVEGEYEGDETIVKLSTEGLDAGLWNLYVKIVDPSNEEMVGWRSATVNVLENSDDMYEGDTVKLVLSDTEVALNRPAMVWAYAPYSNTHGDVTLIAINAGEGRGIWSAPNQGYGVTFISDAPETVDFIATAYYEDGYVATSEPLRYIAVTEGEQIDAAKLKLNISEITEDGMDVRFVPLRLAGKTTYYEFYFDDLTTGESVFEYEDDDSEIEEDVGPYMFDVPADKFEQGHAYLVTAYISAEGSESLTTTALRVYGETDPDVALTVNGVDAAEQSFLTHESFRAKVDFPEGVTDVRLFVGGGFRYLHEEGEEDASLILKKGEWSYRMEEGWPTDIAMYAQVSYDAIDWDDPNPDDMEWSAPSNAILVHVTAGSEIADTCEITVPDSVKQGEALSFDVKWKGNASSLWYWVESLDDDDMELGAAMDKPQQSGAIPTANLEPGLYWLRVNGAGDEPGMVESQSSFLFRVTEPDWDDEAFFIDVTPGGEDAVLAPHQRVAISARRAGAQGIRLVLVDEEGDEDEIERWDENDSVSTIYEGLHVGTNYIYAQVFEGRDEDDEDIWGEQSAWIQINVEGDTDDFRDYELDAATTVAADDDAYTFTVSNLDQANSHWWDIRVTKVVWGNDWEDVYRWTLNDFDAAAEQAFTVPMDKLEPGTTYEISVWADSAKYPSGRLEQRFTVLPAEAQSDGVRLTVRYDGETYDDQLSALSQGELEFTVEAEGATAVKYFNGQSWEWVDDFEDGVGHWDERADSDCYVYWASAYYDEIDWDQLEEDDMDWRDLEGWSAPSNVIKLDVTLLEGELPVPEVEIVDDKETYRKGEAVTVRIAADPDGDPVATNFHAYFTDRSEDNRAYDSREEGEWSGEDMDRGEDITFQVNTIALEPGRSFKLQLDYTALGYAWEGFELDKEFNIVDMDDEILFQPYGLEYDAEADEYVAVQGQEIRFTVNAPGSRSIRVFVDEKDAPEGDHMESFWYENNEDDAGTVMDDMRLDEGEYLIYAAICDEDGEILTATEKLALRVMLLGELEEPEIELPESAVEGSAASFKVTGLEQANLRGWDVAVYDTEAPEGEDWDRVFYADDDSDEGYTAKDGVYTFTIPADALTGDHRYQINVYLDPEEGYGGAYAEARFLAMPAGLEKSVKLEVNGEDKEAEGYAHTENWTIRVTVPTEPRTTGVRIFNGSDWDYTNEIDDDGVAVFDHYYLDTGDYRMFAEATRTVFDYDELNENDVDWESVAEWTMVSNEVAVHVGVRGDSRPAVLDAEAYEVTRGEMLKVRVLRDVTDEVGRATRFSARIDDRYGDNRTDREPGFVLGSPDDLPADVNADAEEGGWLALSTGGLEPGNYTLVVNACASEYEWVETRVPLTVKESTSDDMVFEIQSENLYNQVEFGYAAYKPGAERIEIEFRSEYDDEPEIWGPWDGEDASGTAELGEGNYSMTAIAYDENGDEMQRKTLDFTVGIRGYMDDPVVTGESIAPAGKDYTFTVEGLEQKGARWWDVSVFDTDDHDTGEFNYLLSADQESGYASEDGAIRFTIDGKDIEKDHTYQINVSVNGEGYEGSGAEFRFNGVDADAVHSLLLTVQVGDGEPSDTQVSGMAHTRDWTVRIKVPEGVTAVRLYNRDGWDHENEIDEDGYVVIDGFWVDPGEFKLYAQASYTQQDWDNIDLESFDWETEMAWTDLSNEVQVSVGDRGEALTPVLDQPDGYEVVRGQLVNIRIMKGEDGAEGRPTVFDLYIEDEDGETDWDNSVHMEAERPDDLCDPDDPDSEGGCVYLGSGNLEPGREYWLVVNACAPEYDWTQLRVPLTVKDSEGAFEFEIEGGTLIDRADFTLTAYKPGAKRIYINVEHLDATEDRDMSTVWKDWEGDYIYDTRSLEGGKYRLTAVAVEADGSETESKSLEIEVGYYGALTAPEFAASPLSPAGEDFSFTVNGLHPLETNWYDINVRQLGKEYGEDEFEWRENRDTMGDEAGTFILGKDMLEAGKIYEINVWIDENGYKGIGAQFQVRVYDENSVLTLPAAITTIGENAFEGVAAQVIVLPEDFDGTIEKGAFAGCGNLLAVVAKKGVPQEALEGSVDDVIVVDAIK